VAPQRSYGVCSSDSDVGVKYGDGDLLLKWAGGDAATSTPRLQLHLASILKRETRSIPSRDERSITRHTSLAAVQERSTLRIMRPVSPVVVWLEALVAALVSEGLLKSPYVVSVPGQEVGGEMDVEGLLDVGYDEIIVPRFCTSCDGGRSSCWELADTLYCFDVVEPFWSRKRGPAVAACYVKLSYIVLVLLTIPSAQLHS
jgi:hypothetical protein